MVPVVAAAMPGTVMMLWTMEGINVVELLTASSACTASSKLRVGMTTCTVMEPSPSTTTISAGSITIPVDAKMSPAIACCSAAMKSASNDSSAMSVP
jgi:hypothetical protein